jgi:pimeloyl-ACP methyl ester carboxylesterase
MARSIFPSLLRFVLGLLTLLGVAVAVFAWWWTHPPAPEVELREHWAPLASVDREPQPELGARVERWTLTDERGERITGLWRSAREGTERPWTVVMLGGLGTGDRAALLIPDDIPANVLAVDWPWNGPRKMSTTEFAGKLMEMRAAILRSPAAVALGVDACRDQPEVDASRIALLGVSLGVPPTLAALRLSDAPTALALLDGAAHIDVVLRSDLEGYVKQKWLASLLAALAYRLIIAIEPARNAEAAEGIPTLLISAENDERLPIEAVRALHAAIPHAEAHWRSDIHVNPGRPETIAKLAVYVNGWLGTLGR